MTSLHLLFAFLFTPLSIAGGGPPQGLPLSKLKLPTGFTVELVARVPNARGMALSPKGILYVGSRKAGKVYAVDFNRKNQVFILAEDQDMPTGLAYRDGTLYFSGVSKILKLPKIDERLENPPPPEVVTDKLPDKDHHGWKYLGFGPDGKLYVPVGAPCNNCDENAKDFATIRRMNPDGTQMEVIARGVRNTVGFTWHPKTGEFWFSDNGRDWMGDDVPPCELNRLTKVGSHFGYPHCHGGDLPDPEYGKKRKCSEFTPPVQKLGPHVAPLGIRFGLKTNFPEPYKSGIFIAEHGSWNRSKKIGYQVSFVGLNEKFEATKYETFLTGFLEKESAWGRPVDLEIEPAGSLLVSDDEAGAIYRVKYN